MRCGVPSGVLVHAIHSYVGSGPALTDEERSAVRVALRLHEPYGRKSALESTSDNADYWTLTGAKDLA